LAVVQLCEALAAVTKQSLSHVCRHCTSRPASDTPWPQTVCSSSVRRLAPQAPTPQPSSSSCAREGRRPHCHFSPLLLSTEPESQPLHTSTRTGHGTVSTTVTCAVHAWQHTLCLSARGTPKTAHKLETNSQPRFSRSRMATGARYGRNVLRPLPSRNGTQI
jgi:hypothetical protein